LTFATSSQFRRDLYDASGDGVFEQDPHAGRPTRFSGIAFDPISTSRSSTMHDQVRASSHRSSLDVSASRREFNDGYARGRHQRHLPV
jgi:hypothetical protein